MTVRRINKEWSDLASRLNTGFSASPCDHSNIFEWKAHVTGPSDTPYEGGLFEMKIVFPQQYPFRPPKVRFTTPVYHPNITEHGYLNLDILREQWSPALTLEKVLWCVHSLLQDPNPDDPLRVAVAQQYKSDFHAFQRTARRLTMQYAM